MLTHIFVAACRRQKVSGIQADVAQCVGGKQKLGRLCSEVQGQGLGTAFPSEHLGTC